ncbi:hypothetical protein ACHAPS_002071 [Verticillium nonalfalfae]
MCFLHANAISELVELGKQTGSIEWPAFVGYCICTAGTVHIHGAHYNKVGSGEMNVFSSSSEFLSREMQQLSELRYVWVSVQHQRETLQGIYNAHSELIKSLANNPMRYSPAFHLEDFFDRYANIGGPGGQSFNFDAANLSLADAVVDFTADSYVGHDLYAPRTASSNDGERPNLKRKSASSSSRKRPDMAVVASLSAKRIPTSTFLLTPELRNAATAAFTWSILGQQRFNTPGATAGGDGSGSYDPMFGGLPTNAFSSPAAWQGADDGSGNKLPVAPPQGPTSAGHAAAPSPGAKSTNGSTGTGPGEEKDPFLSLLEQLAENEQQFARGPGNEFDFFFGGGVGANQ